MYISYYYTESFNFIQGQQWVNSVQICLMQKILNSELYNNDDSTCQDLYNFGFKSHPDCFANNGFCVDILQKFVNLDCFAKQFCNDIKQSQQARLAIEQVSVLELCIINLMFIIMIYRFVRHQNYVINQQLTIF